MSEKISQEQISKSLELAKKIQTKRSKTDPNSFAMRMAPIIQSSQSKHFLIRLMDVAFRSKNYTRISAYVVRLFEKNKAHMTLFSSYERVLVRLFRIVGHKLPSISIPLMLGQIKDVTSPIVFLFGSKKFKAHSKKRQADNIKLNVNLIGEALVGEQEASERINTYCELLNQPEINYISIKISTIYSQINSLAHDYCVEILTQKLSIIYNEVLKVQTKTGEQKFVNLDMEEYRDLHLTIDTFIKTLEQPQFLNLRAGIVLQAYLPDSYQETLKLQKWAIERCKKGGAPVKVRVVKGANLEMEKTEASMEEWPQSPYQTKEETDANYKKILLELLQASSAPSFNVGIASHNVFDLGFALNLVKEEDIADHIDFEMLEGMANATVTELLNLDANVLLYTPIVKEQNYINAIAYLVRRLDEGTQEGNFLKEGFNLEVGSEKWESIQKQFLTSLDLIEKVRDFPYRTQNRNIDIPSLQAQFNNVPNTDWTLPANRTWIENALEKWKEPTKCIGETISVVGAKDKKRKTIKLESWNHTLPWDYELADLEDYQEALNGTTTWYDLPSNQKAELLKKAAVKIEEFRSDLICVAITELGKTVQEVDVEVSEAIDFANYYASELMKLDFDDSKQGINLVLSPWNFPIAIPIGGVLASLAANKRVILKPSQNAAACAYLISKCLWKAGIPKDAFMFFPTDESNLDPLLTSGNTFDGVILTGGTETAQFLLQRNPRLNLYAETGGKNCTIITALADREQAVKHVVHSAFGNTGQKCSATSLLILEEEVFNDQSFKSLLKDAVESKIVGNPWRPQTQIGPLAVPISKKLVESLSTTKEDQWLVKPAQKGEFSLTPGVKWGVTTEDFEYNNELFGPILSVMKAKNLKHAIELANGVDFGLTSGIESLDPDDLQYWKQHIQAGNLYINRPTTGAIVQRQPFGGTKASCFGFGMKAGGPNYVRQFANLKQPKANRASLVNSFSEIFKSYFCREIDYAKVRGQHNINRYLLPKSIIVLMDSDTSETDFQIVQTACEVLGVPTKFYSNIKLDFSYTIDIDIVQDWSELNHQVKHSCIIRSLNYERLDDSFLKFCHSKAVHVYGRKPTTDGRVEFLNYLTEQNISINYHRYGNLLGEAPV